MALSPDSSKIVIRSPATFQEWETVKRLLRDYRNEFEDDTCFTSFEEEMNAIAKIYGQKSARKLIAVDSGTGDIVGCVAYRTFSRGVAEMKRLYVVPGYRGYGLGRRLAETIMAQAMLTGFKTMYLDTMLRMHAALQLYHNLGFIVIPPYHLQDPNKVVCFEKTLRKTS